MEKKIYKYNIVFFILFILTYLYEKTYQEASTISLKFPTTFTLLDNSIVLIANNGIHFYDEYFTSEDEEKKIELSLESTDLSKIAMAQFPNEYGEYIIILVKNILYIFSNSKNVIKSQTIEINADTNIDSNYCLVPYKKNDNNLIFFLYMLIHLDKCLYKIIHLI